MVKAPTYEASFRLARERGIDVAKGILSDRGASFRLARTQEEANRVNGDDVQRYLAESDLEGAAAALMQTMDFVDEETLGGYVTNLCKWGDDAFYDGNNCEGALRTFQLAAGLEPGNEEALKGVLSVCLHGEPVLPEIALPYMVILGQVNPKRHEVDYVMRLIRDGAGGYKRSE